MILLDAEVTKNKREITRAAALIENVANGAEKPQINGVGSVAIGRGDQVNA